ncbi:hypothetical protein BBP40_003345 [Aspergillus hancockii]|nr:hypothetical protein BBP40_003345 [Aspergillus hancockii]
MFLLYGVLVLLAWVAIDRLCWHPLSHIPGPKLAGLTGLYEFYFNAIKGGVYIWKIEELHRQYGPIVRVAPNEVHINDPYFYADIYAGNARKRDKTGKWARMLITIPRATAATVDHDMHLSRRNIVLKQFSKRSVQEIEPRMRPHIEKTLHIFERTYRTGGVLAMDAVFSAMGSDITSDYIYGVPLGFLDDPYLKNEMRVAQRRMLSYGHLLTNIPFAVNLRGLLPRVLTRRFLPDTELIFKNEDTIRAMCSHTLECPPPTGTSTLIGTLSQLTVPHVERTLDRIKDECMSFLFAGTETTGTVTSVIMYYLLANPAMLRRLREEVKTVLVSPSDYPKCFAYAELYLIVALLVRRFDLELYHTTVEDVKPRRDYILSQPIDGSQGVRVTVTGILRE